MKTITENSSIFHVLIIKVMFERCEADYKCKKSDKNINFQYRILHNKNKISMVLYACMYAYGEILKK